MPTVIAHVIPFEGQWIVKRRGAKSTPSFRTQKEAAAAARKVTDAAKAGKVVVFDRSGDFRVVGRHGMIERPKLRITGKRSLTRMEVRRAVGSVVMKRLMSE